MRYLLCVILCVVTLFVLGQTKMRPGFDAREYVRIYALSRYASSVPQDEKGKWEEIYKPVYKSPETGLKNQWSFYLRNDNVGVIAIRGTVGDKVSWLANFYAAMIPATGVLHLTDSTNFSYKLAESKDAAVHVGWTVSLGFMAPGIVNTIRENYSKGVKEYYIFGHSQGGVIAYLLRSYLYYLQKDGKLPADVFFKTYCSAAPKPGNTQYAYDFEFINRGGWAFTIINSADWVPETPYTVQRIQDMNVYNPLIHTKQMLQKQKLPFRLIGGYFYGKINRKPRKVQKMYTRFFGNTLYTRAIKKALSQYSKPQYYPSSNYVRAGTPVVLVPDAGYYEKFKEDHKDYFIHHHFDPYYYLVKKYYY